MADSFHCSAKYGRITVSEKNEGRVMSAQQLTYENVLEMFRETNRSIRRTRRALKEQGAEFDRLMKNQAAEFRQEMKESAAEFDRRTAEIREQMQETDLRIKRTADEVGGLGNNVGRFVEHMLGEKILDKFHALGYAVDDYTRNHRFSVKKLGFKGEIDLILHDGDTDILIEAKLMLDIADIRKFIEKIKEFRIYADARWKDVPRFIGAVAGAVVEDDAIKFAHENGLYTIVQSGEAVNIVPTPEGFQAREW